MRLTSSTGHVADIDKRGNGENEEQKVLPRIPQLSQRMAMFWMRVFRIMGFGITDWCGGRGHGRWRIVNFEMQVGMD
jgi:hypothetical protein